MGANFRIQGRSLSWTVIKESHKQAGGKGGKAVENSTIMCQALHQVLGDNYFSHFIGTVTIS